MPASEVLRLAERWLKSELEEPGRSRRDVAEPSAFSIRRCGHSRCEGRRTFR